MADQPCIGSHSLALLDGTEAITKMARLYGLAPRGQRLLRTATLPFIPDPGLSNPKMF